MQALERGRLMPGQRLVETALATEYGVGRNAVREAVQWLAAHGIVDITRHRSAALRRLDAAETLEVLEIAEALIGLLAKAAAGGFQETAHAVLLAGALAAVARADEAGFARARRHMYGTLLEIGGNRALARLFPAAGLDILFAQYRAAVPARQGLEDFRVLATAIANRDVEHAHALGRAHIARLRAAVLSAGAGQDCSTNLVP